ncbi:hypothetical protein Tco_1010946 [Tanacetum coccineum]
MDWIAKRRSAVSCRATIPARSKCELGCPMRLLLCEKTLTRRYVSIRLPNDFDLLGTEATWGGRKGEYVIKLLIRLDDTCSSQTLEGENKKTAKRRTQQIRSHNQREDAN